MQNSWYFDSDYSSDMPNNHSMLTNYRSHVGGLVTFGDDGQSKIEGAGTIVINWLPIFNNVLFVGNLKVNLISVGQLCDDKLMVMVTKNTVRYWNGSCVLYGAKSSDKCYLFKYDILCHISKADFADLWHKLLRHLNYVDLVNLLNLMR